jgi:pyruvate formate lyase activating enzyme
MKKLEGRNAKTGIVGGIQKFSVEDGPGIRTTVFLKGCPLNCAWCHNPELINGGRQVIFSPGRCIACLECVKACGFSAISVSGGSLVIDRQICAGCFSCAEVCCSGAVSAVGEEMSVSEVMKVVLQDVEFYNNTGGGLSISGGEALVQADFAIALLEAAKDEGVNSAVDTCGYGDFEKLLLLAEKCDYLLYDMKLIDPDLHKKYTAVSNKSILYALEKLAAIPGIQHKIFAIEQEFSVFDLECILVHKRGPPWC